MQPITIAALAVGGAMLCSFALAVPVLPLGGFPVFRNKEIGKRGGPLDFLPYPLAPEPQEFLSDPAKVAQWVKTQRALYREDDNEMYREALQYLIDQKLMQHIRYPEFKAQWLRVARQLEADLGDQPYLFMLSSIRHWRSTEWVIALAAKEGIFQRHPPIGIFSVLELVSYMKAHPDLNPVIVIADDCAYSAQQVRSTLFSAMHEGLFDWSKAVKVAFAYMTAFARQRIEGARFQVPLDIVDSPSLVPSIGDVIESRVGAPYSKAYEDAVQHLYWIVGNVGLQAMYEHMERTKGNGENFGKIKELTTPQEFYDEVISRFSLTTFDHKSPDSWSHYAADALLKQRGFTERPPFTYFDPLMREWEERSNSCITTDSAAAEALRVNPPFPTIRHPGAPIRLNRS